MPPQGNKSRNGKSANRDRTSRSRNTTPLSSDTEASHTQHMPIVGDSAYLRTSLPALLVPYNASIENLIDKHSSSTVNPPSTINLNAILGGIKSQILSHVELRGMACDRAMRELAQKRKERIEAERERDERERVEDEKRRREAKKLNGKKRDREEFEEDKRPPAVGAHELARQDGVDVHMGGTDAPSSPKRETGTGSPFNTSETSHQPPPAQPTAQYQSFGDDPTQYDDPTIYDLREMTPDMTDDEKKAILCVAEYPHDDLHDLTPGTPPDMDMSNAKPTNQIAFHTFISYVEPYVKSLTEEDVAFLRERGDRVEPYLIPVRGPMPYREAWAREDGLNPRDPMSDHLPANEARGSIEDMNDEAAATEEVSSGPLLSRLLSIFRSIPSTQKKEDKEDVTDANGDVSMVNGDTTVGDLDNIAPSAEDAEAAKPATYVADLAGSGSSKPAVPATRNFATLEQRMLQELKYSGLLTPEATPDYDSHFDDEVAARLRYLQSELRTVSLENGARKARVLELTEEQMAKQEYSTIADDLDTQINNAYTKRNRTLGKPKKGAAKARPGQTTLGLAANRNMISEGTRMLMERRHQWRDLIGPVVDYGQRGIPKETVFDRAAMERLLKVEGEIGDSEDV